MNDIHQQIREAKSAYKRHFDCMQALGRTPTATQWEHLSELGDKLDELRKAKAALESGD